MTTIELNTKNCASWEIQKMTYLCHLMVSIIGDFGDLIGGVNENSGNTYVYDQDSGICLYMPIHCELKKNDVYVHYTCAEDGEEHETILGDKTKMDIDRFYNVCNYLSERKTR